MLQKNKFNWKYLPTLQAKELLNELTEAKEDISAKLLVSSTGLGKSETIHQFKNKYPINTFVLTVGNSFKLHDVLWEIAYLVDIDPMKYRQINSLVGRRLLKAIADKIQELSIAYPNQPPMLIIDEAENLKVSVLRLIKEIYDAVIKYCSIVLIGTSDILNIILNKGSKNRYGVPQLYRRFKAGLRMVSPLNKARDFTPFFKEYDVNEDVRALLIEHADNYGELRDYLEPLIKYCANKKKELTEETFCLYHKISKTKK